MKKQFLRIALLFCALAMLLTVLAAAWAVEYHFATGGYITFDPDTGRVLGSWDSPTKADIPAKINGVSVTSIQDGAFNFRDSLTEVTIPDSVTSIGLYAFKDCTGLTEIEIPDSVTSTGKWVFEGCTGLTDVTISNRLSEIATGVFLDCASLTEVAIPNSVTSIGGEAFRECAGLTALIIPNSVTTIGDYAFSGCTGLTAVTIPDSVASIDWSAFKNCTGLTAVTIPATISAIKYGAFEGCTGLTDVYYAGTKTQWSAIEQIRESGLISDRIQIHYNSAGPDYPTPTPAAPKLTRATPVSNGITVKWKAVPGVTNYRVYRKTASTGWKTLANAATTSYTDQKAAAGTTYIYTVRCLSDDGKSTISSYNATGISATRPAAPKLTSAAPVSNGITVKWKAVSGVSNYRVYYKTASTSWKTLANVSSTSYTHTKAAAGTTYTYTVRCLSDDGASVISSCDTTGVSAVRPAAPKLISAASATNGITVKWKAVSGVNNYRVYYKTASTGWKTLANVSGTSCTHTKAVVGRTYTYTVRCLSDDGKSAISSYNAKGVSATRQ